jgi:uncharacterized repeat protein (TIGR03803 family)
MRTLRPVRLSKLNRRSSASALLLFVLCATTTIPLSAQTFTSLARFDRKDGAVPMGSLVQGLNGNLYGTTADAGARTGGTIFEVTPGGRLTLLHSFCAQETCADGGAPYAGLALANDGKFYGTAAAGGVRVRGGDCNGTVSGSCGIVFEIDAASNEYTKIYNFCSQANCADGGDPQAALVQAADGNFYGTTYGGGANHQGTVFKITAKGELTTLHSFCSQTNCADGDSPIAGLAQATDGNFYGATVSAGANGLGTIFKITPAGIFTTLYSFCSRTNCADGSFPQSTLIQATNGNLYGTTAAGGANVNDDICPDGCGTIFEMTPGGGLITLYSFCTQTGCTDGSAPGGIIQAADGNFYGVTRTGGANANAKADCADGCGTLFEITPAGELTTLHSFCAQTNSNGICTDGFYPAAPLVQATDGSFYGTTELGGYGSRYGLGTVFSLSMGLGPFVETVSTSGEVGGNVTILGNNLTGATSVAFNGTTATFTVVSSTEITTTVPTGATTGFVTVTTPSATLTSNKKFRVEP